jgi:hypothetical protein
LNVDGRTDQCSQGKDINFVFKGFAITGRVSKISFLLTISRHSSVVSHLCSVMVIVDIRIASHTTITGIAF